MSNTFVRFPLCLLLLVLTTATHAANFLVTSSADSGANTLRQALIDVNNSGGGDSIIISNNLTIQPLTPLPAIERNGTSIVGFGQNVVLDGSMLPGTSTNPALTVESDNCEIGNLIIVNFPEDGILLLGDDNTISECLIGNDGTTAMANGGNGIVINGNDNQIGLGIYTGRNVISGNGGEGILISRENDSSPTGTVIIGNHIGTNEDGTAAIPNGLRGIRCYLCSGMTVGGTGIEDGNLISGNTSNGIQVQQGANLATPFEVYGNTIGLNRAGTAALGNGGRGIFMETPTQIGIGSLILGSANVISGNGNDGVFLRSGADHAPHFIQGNLIGTNPDGTQVIPNEGDGVVLETYDTTVSFNLISGNADDGINLLGAPEAAVQAHVIQSNIIGTNGDGEDFGNGGNGISFRLIATGNLVGGEASQANIIAFNNLGIDADGLGATNTFRRNSIYANTNGGIDLGTFGNDSKAAPVLTQLSPSGQLMGTAAVGDTIDIFIDTADQGEVYIESVLLSGASSFTGSAELFAYAGLYATATATDENGNTSAFSTPLLIAAEGEGEGEGEEGPWHAADQNQNGALDFSELLRIVQLFNADGYGCAMGMTEDGYEPGSISNACDYHTADYEPADWTIALGELLRAIQLFHAGAVTPCMEGEDGFCTSK